MNMIAEKNFAWLNNDRFNDYPMIHVIEKNNSPSTWAELHCDEFYCVPSVEEGIFYNRYQRLLSEGWEVVIIERMVPNKSGILSEENNE